MSTETDKPAASDSAKSDESKTQKTGDEASGNDKVHIFERMIDFTYTATTSIPFGGKQIKKLFDKYKTKEYAKKFSLRFFEPFFPFPKIKKKP
jgi:hypothetical protein